MVKFGARELTGEFIDGKYIYNGTGNKLNTVDSTSAERTVNNVMRHEYKVLSDDEKANMQAIKDRGLEIHEFLESLGGSRELSLAKTKIEEAVMWTVKHITG